MISLRLNQLPFFNAQASKWDKLVALTEEQQAAVAALGLACSSRPIPKEVRIECRE